jgi:hypothetical protein
VLELSFGVDRNFWALMDVFYEQEGERTVFHFPPALAPVTVAVFPLLNKPELIAAAEALYTRLSPHFSSDYDRGGSIGRRYRRHAEVATPYCLTVDFDTVEKGTVTLRDRDSMGRRVALDTVAARSCASMPLRPHGGLAASSTEIFSMMNCFCCEVSLMSYHTMRQVPRLLLLCWVVELRRRHQKTARCSCIPLSLNLHATPLSRRR